MTKRCILVGSDLARIDFVASSLSAGGWAVEVLPQHAGLGDATLPSEAVVHAVGWRALRRLARFTARAELAVVYDVGARPSTPLGARRERRYARGATILAASPSTARELRRDLRLWSLPAVVRNDEADADLLVALYDRLADGPVPARLPDAPREAVRARIRRHVGRRRPRTQRPPDSMLLAWAATEREKGTAEAVEAYREVARAARSPSTRATAAVQLARLGDRAAAMRIADAIRPHAEEDPVARAGIAEIEIALGHVEVAVAQLEAALAAGGAMRRVAAIAARVLDAAGEPTRALRHAEAANDERRIRRLAGLLRTFDPTWTPSVQSAAEATQGRDRVLNLLETSLPHATAGYVHRSANVLSAQRLAGYRPVAVTRIGFPVTRGITDFADVEIVDGVVHHRISLPGVRYATAKPPDELLEAYVERLAPIVARSGPEVIVATTPHLNGVAGLALREAIGVPLIYDVRGFPEMTWAARRGGDAWEIHALRREAETRCMREADAVITLSGVMRDVIQARGVPGDRVRVVPHAVDTARFRPLPRDRRLAASYGVEGSFTVGYVGSLLEYEGLDTVIEAMALVRRSVPTARALIVGDGPLSAQLREHARAHGVEESVGFIGRVAPDEIANHLALLDVVVVPRRDDEVCRYVTALKPFEAMAAARCLVVSDLPALREAVAGGVAGRTFRPGDPEHLAEVLIDLARDADAREAIGQRARRHVLDHHTVEHLSRALKDAIGLAVRARDGAAHGERAASS